MKSGLLWCGEERLGTRYALDIEIALEAGIQIHMEI